LHITMHRHRKTIPSIRWASEPIWTF